MSEGLIYAVTKPGNMQVVKVKTVCAAQEVTWILSTMQLISQRVLLNVF